MAILETFWCVSHLSPFFQVVWIPISLAITMCPKNLRVEKGQLYDTHHSDHVRNVN